MLFPNTRVAGQLELLLLTYSTCYYYCYYQEKYKEIYTYDDGGREGEEVGKGGGRKR
jgi:hypothetical protein